LVQRLPLPVVARVGRFGGGLAFHLDARHRRVALANLRMCFGNEMSEAEISALAKENFRRLGENYCCAIKTAAMSAEQLHPYVEFVRPEQLQPPRRMVMAVGHFGNFELYARFQNFSSGYQCATTYRALKQPELNRLLRALREMSGCLFFERRTDGPLLRAAMNAPNVILGLLADQSSRGMRGPFFGHDCDTGLAPAIFALRYRCELYTAFCFRVAPAKWRLELGDKILTQEHDSPRSSAEIMRDVNRSFENAIRRDPANWFWVHRRWKAQNGPPKAAEPRKAENTV
ncbi:MAG: lysophospholipid acyltransferase family protein, partial [Limisphaerales bacterium]